MNNISSTKFVRILKTFEKDELKAFENWLRSPWSTSNKNLIRIFERLKRHYPEFSDRKLNKKKLFQQVLPDGKYSDRRMNNLLSEAYLAAEQFIIFQHLSRTSKLQQYLLTQELRNRSLDEWFFKRAEKTISELENKEIKDWEDHLDLYQLYQQVYHHPSQQQRLQPGEGTIVKMGEQVDQLYLLEKAVIINEKIFRNRILKDENHEVEAELAKWYAVSEGIVHPAIHLYRLRFSYTTENRLDKYIELRSTFLKTFDTLSAKDQKVHLLSLINDTMLLVKMNQLDLEECLPLYQKGLETGLLMNQGKLTRNTYTVIVSISNTKRTFDFTHHFIEHYTNCLDENIRKDCELWAKAHTAYWEGDLETSLNILQNYAFKVLYLQLVSKVLHTQVYFDLFLKDPSYQFYLFNYFDTFEKWLNREKLWSKANKISFLRFVQKSRKLAKCYVDVEFSPEEVNQLLDGEQFVQALNWLKMKKKEILDLKKKGHPKNGRPLES